MTVWQRATIAYLQSARILRGHRELIVIGTAHKVGSTWLYGILADLCRLSRWRRQVPDDTIPEDASLEQVLEGSQAPAGVYIWKSHAFPPAAAPEWVRWVTMTRDPRDVLVSAAFYLAKLPVESGGWGADFARLSPPERVLRLIHEGDFLKDRLRAWHQCSFAEEVRYERMLAQPAREVGRLAASLGFRVSARRTAQVCDRHSIRHQANRGMNTRKGEAGDWVNHFDARTIEEFRNSDWQVLLGELGYEWR